MRPRRCPGSHRRSREGKAAVGDVSEPWAARSAAVDRLANPARRAFAQPHCHLHTFHLHPADIDGAVTLAEHSAVQEAITACLPDRAEEAMAEHIRSSFTRFSQAFEDNSALSPLQHGGPPQPLIAG
jgi:hypothetical protein